MGLVDYDSGSESSDGEQPVAAPATATPAAVATGGKKQPFQKLVDRANPGKIIVSLPSAGAGTGAGEGDDDTESDGRPAKRARVGAPAGGSRFSGFGAFLPPPKKTAAISKPSAVAAATAAKASEQKRAGEVFSAGTTSRPSVNLKTSSEAAFTRQRAQPTADGGINDGDNNKTSGSSSFSATMSLPPPKAPSIPEGQKAAADVKLVGNPLMFMPLSVSRKTGGKKKAGGKGAVRKESAAATASAAGRGGGEGKGTKNTSEVPAPPKKKVSLFSLGADGEEEAAGEEEGLDLAASADGTYQPLFEDAYGATVADNGYGYEQQQQQQQYQQQQQQSGGSLDTLANDLRLTARERRELFGRAGAGAAVASATFNMDQEYQHNERLRLAGEKDQRQQSHNPVRAVQPGKHSLRQLVTAVQTQQDALEETFAKNRAAQRESGSRYGWR